MRKIYKVLKVAAAASLLSGFIAAGGCTRDEALSAEAVAEAAGSDRVSIESALAALARFEADDPETRGGNTHTVSHVDVLMRSDAAPATRTAGAAADAPLCYIAQFEGGGYAILGADVRQGGVIAYVPEGSLTASELAAAKVATDRGEDYETPTYIHACIVDYLEAAADGLVPVAEAESRAEVQTRGLEFPGGNFDPDAPVQLMKTTWHQDAPFNDACPLISGQRAKVGCVALALGQILAYNKKTFGIGPTVIESYVPGASIFYPNWNYITQAIETPTPAGTYLYAIQSYLAAIGKAVGMNYDVDMSTTYSYPNVVNFLKKIDGYNNIAYKSASLNDIKTQIKTNKTPVYARGPAQYDDISIGIEKGGGHAWVIDGWQSKKEWGATGGGIIGDTMTDVDYLYCRFGYPNAKYDGWYRYISLIPAESMIYRLLNIIYYTL